MSLTGASADHRVPVKPSRLAAVAFALARDLTRRTAWRCPPASTVRRSRPGPADDSRIALEGAPRGPQGRGQDLPRPLRRADAPRSPPGGRTSSTRCWAPAAPRSTSRPRRSSPRPRTSRRCTQGMASGEVRRRDPLGREPRLRQRRGAAFAAALAKVPTSAWIGALPDETAALCKIRSPRTTGWSPGATTTAAAASGPPAARRGDALRHGQGEEVLLAWMKTLGSLLPADYHAYLKARWQTEVYPAGTPVAFERYFEAALHDGFVQLAAAAPAALAFRGEAVRDAASRAAARRRRRASNSSSPRPRSTTAATPTTAGSRSCPTR